MALLRFAPLIAAALYCAQAAAQPPAASRPAFRIGVCTHFSQGKGYLPGNLSVIRQAGVTTIRDEVGWSGIERVKGEYKMPEAWSAYVNAAVEAGLEPLIILDYGNRFYDKGDKPISEEALEGFARYSEYIVKQFRGKVKLYEIWNEWDIGIGGTTPGTAETYASLLAKVYPRIKAIDPSIVVMGGAMTSGGIQKGWLEDMLKAGALKNLDEVSIHTYNYSGTGRERSPEAWAEMCRKVQETVRKYSGGKGIPLNVTEMGWPTQVDRRGTPPEISAAYLSRMYLLGRSMEYMKGIWWYDFQDDGWRHSYNENNFGIVRPDLTAKPSYYALKDLAAFLGDAQFAGRVETADPDIWVLKFRSGGRDVWALWSAHEDDEWQVTLRAGSGQAKPVTVQQVGRAAIEREWGTRVWTEGREAQAEPNRLDLAIRETPWLITGDLTGVTVEGVKRRKFPELLRGVQSLR